MGEKLVALWDLTTNSNVRSFDRLDVTEDDARMAAASMEPRNRPQPSHWTPVPSYGGQYGGRMPYSNNYPPGGYNHPLFVMASSPSGQYVAQQHSPHQMSSPVMITSTAISAGFFRRAWFSTILSWLYASSWSPNVKKTLQILDVCKFIFI